jgi:hypothetical protein
MTPEKLTLEAQSVLDDLWATKKIPFKLTAHKVDWLGSEEYIIRFYDRRLKSIDISWSKGNSFKDAFTVAVLARVARITGH